MKINLKEFKKLYYADDAYANLKERYGMEKWNVVKYLRDKKIPFKGMGRNNKFN